MSHRITEECIVCGACLAECPEQAITEGEDRYIDQPREVQRLRHLRRGLSGRGLPARARVAPPSPGGTVSSAALSDSN